MTAQKYVVWFHEVDKHDIPLVGGKGANLGEMTQAKLPVPPGFIITSHAYYEFLKKSQLKQKIEKLIKNISYTDTRELQKTSNVIQKLIFKTHIPKQITDQIIQYYLKLSNYKTALMPAKKGVVNKLIRASSAHNIKVAVRSSATAEDLPEASFAGQQETFLNVKGEANLIIAVRKAWASLFTARAIFYRHDHGFDHFKVGIALPVQKMVESETSGVMFTVDPVSNNKNLMIIEAIYGLGELIVQGSVTPDQYIIDKQKTTIIHKTISTQTHYMPGIKSTIKIVHPASKRSKQKLPNKKIIELAKIGKKIESHYYFPQDIEWAYQNDTLYIVQTRPITTLDNKEDDHFDKKRLKSLRILAKGDSASPGIASGRAVYIPSADKISLIQQGDILVAEQTNPDFVPAMKKAVAIVTQKGGRTSHAAIVSRELGLPAVVGASDVIKKIKKNMMITVDGTSGTIYEGSVNTIKTHLPQRYLHHTGNTDHIKTATKVYCNLAESSRAEEVAKLNVDGIGLLRAEFMLADIGVHPRWIIEQSKAEQKKYIHTLSEKIAIFCKSFGPQRPVIYRTTDFKTNEYKKLKHGSKYEEDEENPMIGFRGAGRYIKDAEVFELELSAIHTTRTKLGYKNLHVMIPFVRTPEELVQTKRIMAASHLMRSPSFHLYMMAEIPSNVILLDKFIDTGIDGVSIGSNDLTQLTLGVDRDNSKLSDSFNEMNPAVLESIKRIITTCKKRGITSSICGQAPSDYPQLVSLLVQWGITSISVNPDVVNSVRENIYKTEQNLFTKNNK